MKISIEKIAQIDKASVELGDFTVLVGPQGSGKSIFLQLLKLGLDGSHIKSTIKKYGFDWHGNPVDFLQLYLGEGMGRIIRTNSKIELKGKQISVTKILKSKNSTKETVFLIPAQRVLTVQNGWPRNFMSFDTLEPYVVKRFSEDLRLLMESGLGGGSRQGIFPQEGKMKAELRKKIDQSVFFGGTVWLDKQTQKKRMILKTPGESNLPYTGWSSGQREFLPLLLGLYWLMPGNRIKNRENIKYVIIEEPEMGLHPLAIQTLLFAFLELVDRGYKVIVSTHSPVVLELCWAIRMIQEKNGDPSLLFRLFEIETKRQDIKRIFETAIKKARMKTYLFSRAENKIVTKDISVLSPSDEDVSTREWGGITSFSSRATEIISDLFQ